MLIRNYVRPAAFAALICLGADGAKRAAEWILLNRPPLPIEIYACRGGWKNYDEIFDYDKDVVRVKNEYRFYRIEILTDSQYLGVVEPGREKAWVCRDRPQDGVDI